MATFIQLGRRAVNIDQVFEIEDYGDYLRVFYAVTSSDTNGMRQPAYADFEGAEAQALRAWLTQHATQVQPAATWAAPERGLRESGPEGVAFPETTSAAEAADGAGQQADDGFYGVTRLRQMHGAGSDPASGDR